MLFNLKSAKDEPIDGNMSAVRFLKLNFVTLKSAKDEPIDGNMSEVRFIK